MGGQNNVPVVWGQAFCIGVAARTQPHPSPPPPLLPLLHTQLHVLRSPSMSEVSKALSDWKPTHVYLFGGVPGGREDVQAQAIGPFPLLLNAAGARPL